MEGKKADRVFTPKQTKEFTPLTEDNVFISGIKALEYSQIESTDYAVQLLNQTASYKNILTEFYQSPPIPLGQMVPDVAGQRPGDIQAHIERIKGSMNTTGVLMPKLTSMMGYIDWDGRPIGKMSVEQNQAQWQFVEEHEQHKHPVCKIIAGQYRLRAIMELRYETLPPGKARTPTPHGWSIYLYPGKPDIKERTMFSVWDNTKELAHEASDLLDIAKSLIPYLAQLADYRVNIDQLWSRLGLRDVSKNIKVQRARKTFVRLIEMFFVASPQTIKDMGCHPLQNLEWYFNLKRIHGIAGTLFAYCNLYNYYLFRPEKVSLGILKSHIEERLKKEVGTQGIRINPKLFKDPEVERSLLPKEHMMENIMADNINRQIRDRHLGVDPYYTSKATYPNANTGQIFSAPVTAAAPQVTGAASQVTAAVGTAASTKSMGNTTGSTLNYLMSNTSRAPTTLVPGFTGIITNDSVSRFNILSEADFGDYFYEGIPLPPSPPSLEISSKAGTRTTESTDVGGARCLTPQDTLSAIEMELTGGDLNIDELLADCASEASIVPLTTAGRTTLTSSDKQPASIDLNEGDKRSTVIATVILPTPNSTSEVLPTEGTKPTVAVDAAVVSTTSQVVTSTVSSLHPHYTCSDAEFEAQMRKDYARTFPPGDPAGTPLETVDLMVNRDEDWTVSDGFCELEGIFSDINELDPSDRVNFDKATSDIFFRSMREYDCFEIWDLENTTRIAKEKAEIEAKELKRRGYVLNPALVPPDDVLVTLSNTQIKALPNVTDADALAIISKRENTIAWREQQARDEAIYVKRKAELEARLEEVLMANIATKISDMMICGIDYTDETRKTITPIEVAALDITPEQRTKLMKLIQDRLTIRDKAAEEAKRQAAQIAEAARVQAAKATAIAKAKADKLAEEKAEADRLKKEKIEKLRIEKEAKEKADLEYAKAHQYDTKPVSRIKKWPHSDSTIAIPHWMTRLTNSGYAVISIKDAARGSTLAQLGPMIKYVDQRVKLNPDATTILEKHLAVSEAVDEDAKCFIDLNEQAAYVCRLMKSRMNSMLQRYPFYSLTSPEYHPQANIDRFTVEPDKLLYKDIESAEYTVIVAPNELNLLVWVYSNRLVQNILQGLDIPTGTACNAELIRLESGQAIILDVDIIYMPCPVDHSSLRLTVTSHERGTPKYMEVMMHKLRNHLIIPGAWKKVVESTPVPIPISEPSSAPAQLSSSILPKKTQSPKKNKSPTTDVPPAESTTSEQTSHNTPVKPKRTQRKKQSVEVVQGTPVEDVEESQPKKKRRVNVVEDDEL